MEVLNKWQGQEAYCEKFQLNKAQVLMKGFEELERQADEYSGVCVRGVRSEGNRRIID